MPFTHQTSCVLAMVVGSNPTRSTFINLVDYDIELSSFLGGVGQIEQQCPYHIERSLMRRHIQCLSALHFFACTYVWK